MYRLRRIMRQKLRQVVQKIKDGVSFIRQNQLPNAMRKVVLALCALIQIIYIVSSQMSEKTIEVLAEQISDSNNTRYVAEIEKMKADIESLRKEKTSRGEVDRMPDDRNGSGFRRDKVINAIASNLGGVFEGKAEYIYDTSKAYDVNSMLVAAIIKHETANGTSKLVRKNNNPGGILGKNGFAKYKTIDSGIDAMAKLLKTRYIDKGLTSIDKIQKVYCPVGASNDPQGLNKMWFPKVNAYYQEILSEAIKAM